MIPSTEQLAITTGLRGILFLRVVGRRPPSQTCTPHFRRAVSTRRRFLARLCACPCTIRWAGITCPGFYDVFTPPETWELRRTRGVSTSARQRWRLAWGPPPFPRIRVTPLSKQPRFLAHLGDQRIGGGYQGEGSKTSFPRRFCESPWPPGRPGKTRKASEPASIPTIKARVQPSACALRVEPGHSGPPYRVVPPDGRNPPRRTNLPRFGQRLPAPPTRRCAPRLARPPLCLREGGSVAHPR